MENASLHHNLTCILPYGSVPSHPQNLSSWRQRDSLVASGFPWDPRGSAAQPTDGFGGTTEGSSSVFGVHPWLLTCTAVASPELRAFPVLLNVTKSLSSGCMGCSPAAGLKSCRPVPPRWWPHQTRLACSETELRPLHPLTSHSDDPWRKRASS